MDYNKTVEIEENLDASIGKENLVKEKDIPKEPVKTLTEAEQKELDEKEMREFLANEENKQHALHLSDEIATVMRGKWFTINKLAVKAKINEFSAFQKVNMCKMFGHVVEKVGTANDGPDKKGQKLFKVTISIDDKIKAIDDVITYIKNELSQFELQKKILIAEKLEK